MVSPIFASCNVNKFNSYSIQTAKRMTLVTCMFTLQPDMVLKICQYRKCHIPEDGTLCSHNHGNHKSQTNKNHFLSVHPSEMQKSRTGVIIK